MSELETYNVAQDFSPNPIARYARQSQFSGEVFRRNVLEPRLKRKEKFILDFSGTSGAGSSFLEEAFAGLIRIGYSKTEVLESIEIIWPLGKKSYAEELNLYLDRAGESKS